MNRKSLMISLAALGAMLLAMVIAIAVLYHDDDKKESDVEARYELFQAVPSDAVAMGCLSHVKDVSVPRLRFPVVLIRCAFSGTVLYDCRGAYGVLAALFG